MNKKYYIFLIGTLLCQSLYSSDSASIMHSTIIKNDHEALQDLLTKGASVETTWADATILHLAVQEGKFECTSVLLDNGANVNSPNRSKETPLHIAAYNNDEHIVRLLLMRGANKKSCDCSGNTPADKARLGRAAEVIIKLLA